MSCMLWSIKINNLQANSKYVFVTPKPNYIVSDVIQIISGETHEFIRIQHLRSRGKQKIGQGIREKRQLLCWGLFCT